MRKIHFCLLPFVLIIGIIIGLLIPHFKNNTDNSIPNTNKYESITADEYLDYINQPAVQLNRDVLVSNAKTAQNIAQSIFNSLGDYYTKLEITHTYYDEENKIWLVTFDEKRKSNNDNETFVGGSYLSAISAVNGEILSVCIEE